MFWKTVPDDQSGNTETENVSSVCVVWMMVSAGGLDESSAA